MGTVIDDHLAGLPEPQRTTLTKLAETLRRVLPTAEERISYAMPCFAVQGKAVAGFEGFKQHCSYFPHSGGVLARMTGEVPEWCTVEKGTLKFPADRPLPVGLVRRLVRVRLDEISEVTKGRRFEFFDDGTVKAEGMMRDGQPHGDWSWYRRDGTVLRTARFDHGARVD